jgi:hypothetical protein
LNGTTAGERDELYLFGGESTNFLAVDDNRADQSILFEHRYDNMPSDITQNS